MALSYLKTKLPAIHFKLDPMRLVSYDLLNPLPHTYLERLIYKSFLLLSKGMLKDKQDGSVMKAAVKPVCGAREIQFYEQLNGGNLKDPNLETMRKFVPEYRGTVKMPFRGKIIDFIKLGDLTHDMAEPCVIDIKIGKRTWDPFASVEKQQAEEQKYEACKQNLGFCIPGFQVYDIKSGRIKRFGKEYGKKLNQNTVKDGKQSTKPLIFF